MSAARDEDSWRGLQLMATTALKAVRDAGDSTRVGKNAISEASWAIGEAVARDDRPVKWTKKDMRK